MENIFEPILKLQNLNYFKLLIDLNKMLMKLKSILNILIAKVNTNNCDDGL